MNYFKLCIGSFNLNKEKFKYCIPICEQMVAVKSTREDLLSYGVIVEPITPYDLERINNYLFRVTGTNVCLFDFN